MVRPISGGTGPSAHRSQALQEELTMRRLVAAMATAVFVTALAVSTVAAAAGPPGLAFYVDGERYRTVATPTDLSDTGAPEQSYDRIYALGNGLINVAEAKPGDRDYNGGRWIVLGIEWHVAPVQLTSAEQVEAYADMGKLTIGTDPLKMFVCTVNRVPAGQ
jgi:hypothetical protein